MLSEDGTGDQQGSSSLSRPVAAELNLKTLQRIGSQKLPSTGSRVEEWIKVSSAPLQQLAFPGYPGGERACRSSKSIESNVRVRYICEPCHLQTTARLPVASR